MPPQGEVDVTPPLTFSVWLGGIIRRWALILKVMAAVLLVGLTAAVLLPPIYRARASFVANKSSNSPSSGNVASLGSMRGRLAGQLLPPMGDPTESPEFYARLIESDELKRRLAQSRFADERPDAPGDSARLMDILGIPADESVRQLELAVRQLGSIVKTKFEDATYIVEVTVQTRWPALTAAIANRTVELVGEFNREQRTSRARAKREFLEQRVATAYQELQRREDDQRMFYEQNREWRNSPSLVFEESRIKRNVELTADLYLTLQREFENARLEEFNDVALITVVDTAAVPQRPAWPKFGLLTSVLIVLGGMLGLMAAGGAAVLQDWRRRNPVGASFLRDSLDAAPLPLRRRKRQPREGGAPVR